MGTEEHLKVSRIDGILISPLIIAATQIPVEDEERHLSQKHRFEMVWSRTRSLEKIDIVTQPSKDLAEDSSLKGRPRGGVGHSVAKKAKIETQPSKLDDSGLSSGTDNEIHWGSLIGQLVIGQQYKENWI